MGGVGAWVDAWTTWYAYDLILRFCAVSEFGNGKCVRKSDQSPSFARFNACSYLRLQSTVFTIQEKCFPMFTFIWEMLIYYGKTRVLRVMLTSC